LNSEEWHDLKSKISTSSWGGKNKLPKAFTDYAEENTKPKTKFNYLFSMNDFNIASA